MSEFINEIIEIRNEDLIEEKSWEYYLHKVWEQTYAEYRKEAGLDTTGNAQSSEELDVETTINESRKISKGTFQ